MDRANPERQNIEIDALKAVTKYINGSNRFPLPHFVDEFKNLEAKQVGLIRQGQTGVAMSFAHGKQVYALLGEKQFSKDDIHTLARAISAAVVILYDAGFIYCADLNPMNVMYDMDSKRVTLVDLEMLQRKSDDDEGGICPACGVKTTETKSQLANKRIASL